MTIMDHYLLDAVRIGLSACVAGRKRKHPDSSRQHKTRQRDVTRYEARRMKERQPTYLPKLPSTYMYKFVAFDFEPTLTGRSASQHMTLQEQSEHARRWLRVGGFDVRAR